MGHYKANLKERCARIVPDLDNCTNQDKKDAYTYLDLKVKATPESADIKGYLDSSMIKSGSCLLTMNEHRDIYMGIKTKWQRLDFNQRPRAYETFALYTFDKEPSGLIVGTI